MTMLLRTRAAASYATTASASKLGGGIAPNGGHKDERGEPNKEGERAAEVAAADERVVGCLNKTERVSVPSGRI